MKTKKKPPRLTKRERQAAEYINMVLGLTGSKPVKLPKEKKR